MPARVQTAAIRAVTGCGAHPLYMSGLLPPAARRVRSWRNGNCNGLLLFSA